MSTELANLAASAANTVVALMLTDTWNRARSGVISLWQRSRPEQGDDVARDLDDSRSELERAREVGDSDTEGELQAQWAGRFRRFLRDHPAAAEDLRALLNETRRPEDVIADVSIRQTASASGRNARVYQAGGDQINH